MTINLIYSDHSHYNLFNSNMIQIMLSVISQSLVHRFISSLFHANILTLGCACSSTPNIHQRNATLL